MFDEIKNLILSRTAKDTYVVFVGNVVSFVFGIFFVILAARKIDPSGWGVFSAAGAFMLILFSFSELGLSSGLFKFVSRLSAQGKESEVNAVASVILIIRLATSLIFCSLIFVFAAPLSLLLLKINNSSLMYLTAAGLLGVLLIDFQISLIQAKRKWLKSAIVLSLTSFFRLSFLIISSYLGKFSLVTLFAVFFLSPFVTFFTSLLFERPKLRLSSKSFSIFKKVSKFSLWMGLNGSVNSIAGRVDSILLIQLLGPFETGIVGAAKQLGNAVLILLASFATVIAARFSSYSGSKLVEYFKKTVSFSYLLAAGVLVGIIFVDPIISLLGAKYALSMGVLMLLLVSYIPFALASPAVSLLIYAFHKPNIIATLSLLQLPLIVVGNILLIPKLGIYAPIIVIGLWNLSTYLVVLFKSKWELSRIH